jgi:hypothetical protein
MIKNDIGGGLVDDDDKSGCTHVYDINPLYDVQASHSIIFHRLPLYTSASLGEIL